MRNLTGGQVGLEEPIVNSGAVSGLLITALFRSDTIRTKHICISALYNLMVDPVARKLLLNDEIIWGYTRLALENRSEGIRDVCARALASLSHYQDIRAFLVSQKAMAAVRKICSDIESHTDEILTLRGAAVALRNLTSDADAPHVKVSQSHQSFRAYLN